MRLLASAVLFVLGAAVFVAALVGQRRHPEWNWRYGPARWLGTLAMVLLCLGLFYLVR